MYGVYVKLTMKDRLRRRKRNPHLSVLSLSICSHLVRERARWGWWWFKEEESSSPICSLLVWEEERGCIQNAADTTKKHKLLYLSPRFPTTFASTIRSTTGKARQPTRGRPLSLSFSLSLSVVCRQVWEKGSSDDEEGGGSCSKRQRQQHKCRVRFRRRRRRVGQSATLGVHEDERMGRMEKLTVASNGRKSINALKQIMTRTLLAPFFKIKNKTGKKSIQNPSKIHPSQNRQY